MEVRRALVIGIGKSSIPTLQKLHTQVCERHGDDIYVIKSLLIVPPDDNVDTKSLLPPIHQLVVANNDLDQDQIKSIVSLIHGMLHQDVVRKLSQRGIQVNTDDPIEFIVVGNLEEAFVTNHLLALSQSIYPKLSDVEKNPNQKALAILAVPPLGVGMSDDNSRVSHALQTINEYLEKQGNRRQMLKAENRAIQKVYLLETTNSANVSVQDTSTLLWMVGDWLYYYLTSNVVPTFDDPQNEHTFASLGYASLFVPEPQMRQVLANWFIHEAFQDYFLANPGMRLSDEDEQKQLYPDHAKAREYFRKHVANVLAASDLSKDSLGNKALLNNESIPRPILHIASYSSKPFYLYEELEQEIAQGYVRQIQEVLDNQTRTDQKRIRGDIVETVEKKLLELRDTYLDKARFDVYFRYAPLRTTEHMLELIIEEWKCRCDEQKQRIDACEKTIEGYADRISSHRAAYWDTARMFAAPTWLGVPFLVPLVGGFVGVLVMGYLSLVLHQLLGQTILAWVLFILTILVTVSIPIFVSRRVDKLKNELLRDYSHRLQEIREQHEAIQMYKLYKQLIDSTRLLQSPITRAIENLNNCLNPPVDLKRSPYKRTDSQERNVPEGFARAMYDTPSYELEVSVVGEEDLRDWYDELFKDVQARVQDFIAKFSLSKRLREDATLTTLIDDLQKWIEQEKLSQLRTATIQRYLKKYSSEQQRRMLDQMIQRAHIYVRIDAAAVQDPEQLGGRHMPDLEKHHVRMARQDRPFLEKLLEYTDKDRLNIAIMETEDPLRVDTVSVLNWVPLNSIEMARRFQIIGNGTPDIRLQDDLTGQKLDMYELVALARAMGVLKEDEGGIGYYKLNNARRAGGDTNPYDFCPLGGTFSSVVTELGNPSQRENRKSIHSQVVKKLQEMFQQDNGKTLGKTLFERHKQTDTREEQQALTEYLEKLDAVIHPDT